MRASEVSLDLMEFVEAKILPRYAAFDKAHGLAHVSGVIRRSLLLAAQCGAEADMAYVVAAYHDLGLSGPRAVHHLTSGRILASDRRLRRWFSQEQIRIMKEAVEDHRASAAHAPRSIYGRIVAEADRDLDPDSVLRRTVEYGLAHYPEMDRAAQWERFLQHLRNKYSAQGYIRLWMPNSPNRDKLAKIREIVADEALLRQRFDAIYDAEKR